MGAKAVVDESYSQFVSLLKKEIEKGHQAVERQKALTYWRVGEHIDRHILQHKDRAGYGEQLFVRLSQDLQIGQRTLQRAVQFYHQFPIPSGRTQLTWTHYRALISIKDQNNRERLLKKTVERHLNTSQLDKEIRQLKSKQFSKPPSSRSVILDSKAVAQSQSDRGHLYTYRLNEEGVILPIKDHVVVDCGFGVRCQVQAEGLSRAGKNQMVELKTSEAGFKVAASDRAEKSLYTYQASVERVIDGDTLWVNLDLGFRTWIKQKIRLKGIDAPELTTAKGRQAKRLVERAIKGLDFIIIKTYKDRSDKYDRYLADIFYRAAEKDGNVVAQEGEHLNQQLLQEGLAVIW